MDMELLIEFIKVVAVVVIGVPLVALAIVVATILVMAFILFFHWAAGEW